MGDGNLILLPRYEVVIEKTFVNGFIFEGNEGLRQDEGQGLPRCNSAPGRLEGNNDEPSTTLQPAASGQPLLAHRGIGRDS